MQEKESKQSADLSSVVEGTVGSGWDGWSLTQALPSLLYRFSEEAVYNLYLLLMQLKIIQTV